VKSSEERQGLLAIIGANVIFGLNIPITKALVESWMTPMGYTTTRMLFGTLLFWGLGVLGKKEKVGARDLLVIAVGGLLGYLGTQFLFSQSLMYTSPVVYSLLMALTPVFVLLLAALFLKERIPMRKILGILTSIVGATLVIVLGAKGDAQRANNVLGIVFALLCVLSYAGYLVITRSVSVKYQPVTIAKYMFLVSAVVAAPFGLSDLSSQKVFSIDTTGLALGLLGYSLVFSTFLAFFLMPYALKRLEAGSVSIFMNLQPIVASAAAIAVGQDFLSWEKIAAVILVVAGVYFVTSRQRIQQGVKP